MSSFLQLFACGSKKSLQTGETLKRKNSTKAKKGGNRQSQLLDGEGSRPSAPPPDYVDSADYYSTSEKPVFHSQLSSSTVNEMEGGDSFWDLKNYKIALKRYDNGHKLTTELAEMIEQRALIEDNYAKSLQTWKAKWGQYLETETVEYGTTRKAWLALLDSGAKTAEVHLDAKTRIHEDILTKTKQFIKDKYQKHFVNFKKTKELEDEFEEAQKNWAKLLERMNKAKREYYDAIKSTRSAVAAAREADSNAKVSEENRQKLHAKAESSERDQDAFKRKYESTLTDLEANKQKYIDDMSRVFQKTQNLEQERMVFFKQMLLECHSILQTYNDDRHGFIFNELKDSIERLRPEEDTEWWSNKYGPGTKPNWPKFEEYRK